MHDNPAADADGFLQGQFLIAMPTIGDPRFERALIYVCSHTQEGAMGLMVNKPADGLTFHELLGQVGIEPTRDVQIESMSSGEQPILLGGPVEPGRGFVLHSQDYLSRDSSLPVSEDVAMTATVDILRAMARGTGPSQALVALGYAGWGAGQLEAEIQHNGWLTCGVDDDLLFSGTPDTRYERALAKLGIDLSLLSGEAGHA